MKPIFVIGATILAAGAAFGFARAVDRLAVSPDTAAPAIGIAAERSVSPALPPSEIRKGIRPLEADSAGIRDVADIPTGVAASSDLPQAQGPASGAQPALPEPSAEVAALDYDIQPAAPVNYFVAPEGQDMPGLSGTSSATALPDEAAQSRFEKVPMIGVYR